MPAIYISRGLKVEIRPSCLLNCIFEFYAWDRLINVSQEIGREYAIGGQEESSINCTVRSKKDRVATVIDPHDARGVTCERIEAS